MEKGMIMDKAEEMARKYIEGIGGLFDMYKYEMVKPLCEPPEVEGARWLITSLINPKNKADLMALVKQLELRDE